jgi:hypothetical protein
MSDSGKLILKFIIVLVIFPYLRVQGLRPDT